MSPAAYWTCPPPCSAVNPARAKICEMCGATRADVSDAAVTSAKQCVDCGEKFLLWTSLTEGTDGKRRCATCHIAYLKARQDHAERCECGKLVKDHIAEFKRAGALMSERVVKL